MDITQSLSFHAQALSLRSERQRLIASNIANADTPGYVARDMNFAQALKEATGSIQPARALTVQPFAAAVYRWHDRWCAQLRTRVIRSSTSKAKLSPMLELT